MKKPILAIFIIIFFAPQITPYTNAAQIFSENSNTLEYRETKIIWPIKITADSDGEIIAQNGINIFFDDSIQLLWDDVDSLKTSGSAVDNSKIASPVIPEYKNNYHVLHIPVLADFSAGESVTIDQIKIRVYKKAYRRIYWQLDTNGDLIAEAQDLNKTTVIDQFATDFTPPYPPQNFVVTPAADLSSVTMTWVPSADYDSWGSYIDRRRIRNGATSNKNILTKSLATAFADTDVQEGDILTYELYASDGRNFSEKVTQTITLIAKSSKFETSPANVKPESESDSLTRLFNFYKVRQAIKCNPSGNPVPEGNSACIWAKINLLYAQQVLNRADVDLSLSERERYLMGIRLPFAVKRHQKNCENTLEPAPYCSALQKAINRAEFLIDENLQIR